MSVNYYFFERLADGSNPAGITVSKQEKLPRGNFIVDEWLWGNAALWFVRGDKFTADERNVAMRFYFRRKTNDKSNRRLQNT